jgi:hypothetical protein
VIASYEPLSTSDNRLRVAVIFRDDVDLPAVLAAHLWDFTCVGGIVVWSITIGSAEVSSEIGCGCITATANQQAHCATLA